jgi:hypothetical protein
MYDGIPDWNSPVVPHQPCQPMRDAGDGEKEFLVSAESYMEYPKSAPLPPVKLDRGRTISRIKLLNYFSF